MKNYGVVIGIFLGMAAVSMVLYIINKTAYKGNDVTKAVPLYMARSVQFKITDYVNFNFGSYKKSVYADQDGDVTQVLFYSQEHKKYFNLLLYDDQMTDDRQAVMYIRHQQVMVTVNQDDLDNPKYGSKTLPVPVFKFDVVSPKIDYPVLHTKQESYIHNVTQYLKYVMPADVFSKRFG